MLGLAAATAAPAGFPHVVRQQSQASQLAATGRSAAATTAAAAAAAVCLQSRHRRRRPSLRSPSSLASSALDEAAEEAAAAAASSGRGAADSVQPPSSSWQAGSSDAGGSMGGSSDEEDLMDMAGANAAYLQHCQQEYGKPGLIEFSEGANGLPRVTLLHPAGPRCELYLHGAAVTSWRNADGRELLHLREGNAFNGEDAINGGIQVAWPQYGVGPLPTHGFLQNLHWSVVETSWREPDADQPEQLQAADASTLLDWRPTISLYADTDDTWASSWPHKFEALYTVTLMQPEQEEPSDAEVLQQAAERYQPWRRQEAAAAAARGGSRAGSQQQAAEAGERQSKTPSVLRCVLQVHNADDKPFTFTTGLRTHFATQDIARHPKFVKTLGLRGKYCLDYSANPLKPSLGVENEDHVLFGDMAPTEKVFVDCDADGDILFCPGTPSHFRIHNTQGFSDIGISHPTTIVPREARRFVGMSSARAVRKITLQPGDAWVGEMVLTAYDRYWDLPAWELDDPSGVPIPEQTPDQLPPRRPNLVEGAHQD